MSPKTPATFLSQNDFFKEMNCLLRAKDMMTFFPFITIGLQFKGIV